MMPDDQAGRKIAAAFGQVIAYIVLFNDSVAQQVGLSASESQLLHLLQIEGEATPGELARRSGLSSATVTGVLDRLERLGFASRRRHPDDRRKVIVELVESAVEQQLAPHFAKKDSALRGAIEAVPTSGRRHVLTFLESLLESERRSAKE